MLSLANILSSSSASSIRRFLPIYKIHSPTSLNSTPAESITVEFASRTNKFPVNCCSKKPIRTLRTCKNCKTQFDPALNHPRACCFHTAHFGGETKRKFESVYTGGTMNTPDSGQVFQYWHCCGSEDPFDPGCTSAPHTSYDDY